MNTKKIVLLTTTVLTLSSIAIPFVSVNSISNVEAATAPVNYNQWKTIRTQKLSPAQTKQMAKDVQKGRNVGTFTSIAGAWLYKVPALGASVSTLGALMQNSGGTILKAAQQNKGITLTYQQKVHWDGYSPRTRLGVTIN